MQRYDDGCHCVAETDIAVSDSTWDEGKVEGDAAERVQAVVLGTGEPWMQRALAAMGSSFRGRAAGDARVPQPSARPEVTVKLHESLNDGANISSGFTVLHRADSLWAIYAQALLSMMSREGTCCR